MAPIYLEWRIWDTRMEAVSYTHLDVYKRQTLHNGQNIKQALVIGKQDKTVFFWQILNSVDFYFHTALSLIHI